MNTYLIKLCIFCNNIILILYYIMAITKEQLEERYTKLTEDMEKLSPEGRLILNKALMMDTYRFFVNKDKTVDMVKMEVFMKEMRQSRIDYDSQQANIRAQEAQAEADRRAQEAQAQADRRAQEAQAQATRDRIQREEAETAESERKRVARETAESERKRVARETAMFADDEIENNWVNKPIIEVGDFKDIEYELLQKITNDEYINNRDNYISFNIEERESPEGSDNFQWYNKDTNQPLPGYDSLQSKSKVKPLGRINETNSESGAVISTPPPSKTYSVKFDGKLFTSTISKPDLDAQVFAYLKQKDKK
jgi:hypothetical protein